MGFIQTAFAASQVLGIPFGLYLSNRWNWHVPFMAMAALGVTGGLIVAWLMKPVADHLQMRQEHSPWMHLFHTVTDRRYLLAFVTTSLMATGGFMLMPFSSAFTVNNLGIALASLPTIYLVTGLAAIFVGPLVGKAADAIGKLPVFMVGSTLTIIMVLIYTHLGVTSLAMVIAINVTMFIGIFSRMIPFQALMSTVPTVNQRGSFSAIGASVQQLSGGLAAVIAGHIVTVGADGKLQHYDMAGYVVVGTTLITVALLWYLQRDIGARTEGPPIQQAAV